MYSRFARHRRLFTLAQKFAALTSPLLSLFSQWIRLPAFTGWGYSKDLPKFAGKSFREKFQKEDISSHVALSGAKGLTSSEKDSSSPSAPHTVPMQFRESDMNHIERFTKELTAVHGHVHHTEDPTQSIIQFLQSRDINRIQLEPNVLNEDLLTQAGITFSREPDPAIRVGVTKAQCGVADTGSMLEADGEGKLLHASLLPEIHLAVLYTSQIYPSLENAIHLVKNTKSAVFITGPSATGDIESVHTIGVHGPGEVRAFLVDG